MIVSGGGTQRTQSSLPGWADDQVAASRPDFLC